MDRAKSKLQEQTTQSPTISTYTVFASFLSLSLLRSIGLAKMSI